MTATDKDAGGRVEVVAERPRFGLRTARCPFCEASNHVELLSINGNDAIQGYSTCVHLADVTEGRSGVVMTFAQNVPSGREWKGGWV